MDEINIFLEGCKGVEGCKGGMVENSFGRAKGDLSSSALNDQKKERPFLFLSRHSPCPAKGGI